jgi:hypothetical protein
MSGKYKKEVHQARALERRQVIAAYKVTQGCIDCGYNKDARALEFDHRPGTKKNRTVASSMYASWEYIWAEIAKCDVVCCNCHAIRTFERKEQGSLAKVADAHGLGPCT